MTIGTVIAFGDAWEVEYTFTKGIPGRHTLANGDPGYPEEPPEVEISSVKVDENDTELIDYINGELLSELRESIIEDETDSEGDVD